MQEIKFRKAGIGDINEISRLAKMIWHQHYLSLIGEAQVKYMLELMYSAEALTVQISVKKHQFFLIESNGENIGFISLNNIHGDEWFLNKFYIDQGKANKGIGGYIFNSIVELLQPKKITLTVNRGNYKSINLYFKLGFKIEKCESFDIGNGFVMDDFVMVWLESKKV